METYRVPRGRTESPLRDLLQSPPRPFNPYLDRDPDQPIGAPVALSLGCLMVFLVAIGIWKGWMVVGAAAVGLFQ